MESQDTHLDVSDFALADAQFLPTSEEMDRAAIALKPVAVRVKKSHRAWGKVGFGIGAICIAWLSIIFNIAGFENVHGTGAESKYVLYLVLHILMGINLTTIFGYLVIYSGLHLYSTVLSVDDKGITFGIYKNEKKHLRWQDIRWWQILNFSGESPSPYCMYNFHPKEQLLGTSGYVWYEPAGAYMRNKDVVGDQYIAFQQQMRLARAAIALHIGPPRGEPLESLVPDKEYENHDASQRA